MEVLKVICGMIQWQQFVFNRWKSNKIYSDYVIEAQLSLMLPNVHIVTVNKMRGSVLRAISYFL